MFLSVNKWCILGSIALHGVTRGQGGLTKFKNFQLKYFLFLWRTCKNLSIIHWYLTLYDHFRLFFDAWQRWCNWFLFFANFCHFLPVKTGKNLEKTVFFQFLPFCRKKRVFAGKNRTLTYSVISFIGDSPFEKY